VTTLVRFQLGHEESREEEPASAVRPQPLASSVPGRHDDHEQIVKALRKRDQARTKGEMEAHIVGTVPLIRAETQSASAGDEAEGRSLVLRPPQ
jgi:DNA-binding GntR family transcriptional regulator